MKPAVKSILAVGGAFLLVAVLSVLTDTVLEQTGVFPPPSQGLFVPWMLTLALAYRTGFALLGGWIAARSAPRAPYKHVLVMGAIGIVLTMLGTIAAADKSPLWYPIAIMALTLPAVLAGAALAQRGGREPRGASEVVS